MTSILNNKHQQEISEALSIIQELGLCEFIRNFDGSNGFMYINDNRLIQIGDALSFKTHKTSSLATTLRNVQDVLRSNKENDKNNVLYQSYNTICNTV